MRDREEDAKLRSLLPETAVESRRPELDQALLRLAEELLRADAPADVATSLLEVVVSTYGFPRGAVLVRAEHLLSTLALHGALETGIGPGTSSAVQRALEQQAVQVVAALDPDAEPWLARIMPAASDLLVLPLADEQRPLGALVLQVPTALRGPQGRRVLREIERGTALAAPGLHRVQRLVHLQRLAATDDLTMIANRRSFLMSLDRELAGSLRRSEPVSLVLLDLDNFKQVNDRYGHPAGDEALRNAAAALTIACRDLDTAARYGGEEFALILPDCDVDRSRDVADRFRAAVAAAPAVVPLTASAGVATFPHHASDAEQLIAAADAALLEAKRAGRNRTVARAAPPAETEADAEKDTARR